MSGTIFLVLGGLVALGFLVVVWRRRQMPVLLRAILIIGAAGIVIYVAWTLVFAVTVEPALRP
jgi:LPXTG-motif cell wall-anchored protein